MDKVGGVPLGMSGGGRVTFLRDEAMRESARKLCRQTNDCPASSP